MTVMVPFSNVDTIGLRKITRNAEITRVLAFLSSGSCQFHADWKSRFKENSEKMLSGSLLCVAEVLKGLLLLQIEKPLSFREKKMLDRARHMLVTELSMARRVQEPEASAFDTASGTLITAWLAPNVFQVAIVIALC
jgi:CarD family transcriptional regulator